MLCPLIEKSMMLLHVQTMSKVLFSDWRAYIYIYIRTIRLLMCHVQYSTGINDTSFRLILSETGIRLILSRELYISESCTNIATPLIITADETKMYWLGGETDSCDPMKIKSWCDVVERTRGSSLLRTFLKPSLKMPSIFCEFGYLIENYVWISR